MVLLALVLFGDFNHPLERQDAVERWRSCLHLSRKALERGKDCTEDRLIHLHSRLGAFALNGEIGIDRAPREFFRAAGTRWHFHCIPPSRKSKSQVQAFGVYRFDLPRPRVSAGYAMASSKTGHARQSHGFRISRWYFLESVATLAARTAGHKGEPFIAGRSGCRWHALGRATAQHSSGVRCNCPRTSGRRYHRQRNRSPLVRAGFAAASSEARPGLAIGPGGRPSMT